MRRSRVADAANKFEIMRHGGEGVMMRTGQYISRFKRGRATVVVAAIGAATLVGGAALAQSDYPNKPIRILVGFAAGCASVAGRENRS